MIAEARDYLLKAVKLYDVLIMACCFAAAAIISHAHEMAFIGKFLSLRLEIHNFVLFLCLLLLWHLIFTSFWLYDSKRLTTRWVGETLDVLKATTAGTLAILLIGRLFDIGIVSLSFSLIFWSLVSSVTILSRFVLRYILHEVRRWGRNLNHVLIVGTNPRALGIAKTIESKREFGYHLVGFVDDHWHWQDGAQNGHHSLIADLNGLQGYLRDNIVDEVIICVPIKSFYDKASRILAQCEEQGITVRFISDTFTAAKGRSYVDQFDDQYVLTVATGALKGPALLLKRLVDFTGSLLLLTALSPLLLIVASLIKTTSPGPVFFVQERVGLNKRRFRLYKFRTMLVDAEKKQRELEDLNEMSGPVFKIKNDPRITPLGKLLRKTSIDELPQLINVLKGNMSLVGPRPLPVRDYEGFELDWHRRRLSVRPGITCLWQVAGRNSIPFEKWMELDLQYIDQWSLWLDLKILLKTIPAVLKTAGAS